jgi:predicted DNA-binding transcriptional regulator AlpA
MKLEAVMAHLKDVTNTQPRRLPGPKVDARYFISRATRHRWIRDGKLPPADFRIGNRSYWYESTLDQWDAQLVAEHHAA